MFFIITQLLLFYCVRLLYFIWFFGQYKRGFFRKVRNDNRRKILRSPKKKLLFFIFFSQSKIVLCCEVTFWLSGRIILSNQRISRWHQRNSRWRGKIILLLQRAFCGQRKASRWRQQTLLRSQCKLRWRQRIVFLYR